jgi:FHA domain-containing protein
MELHVISYGSHALAVPLSASLTPAGLSIGRGGENELSLPDAERLVSRQQAKIEAAHDGSHVITNVSHSNSFLINDFELVPGQQAALKSGDELRMGRFVILVSDRQPAASASATVQPCPEGSAVGALSGSSTLDPLSGFGVEDPDDPLGMGLATGFRPSSFPPPVVYPAGKPGQIPEDFNPFDLPSAAGRNTDDPFAEIARTGETSLEQLVYPATQREDLLSGLPRFDANALVEEDIGGLFGIQSPGSGDSLDPLALFGEENPDCPCFAAAGASQYDHAPEISAAFRPPEVFPIEEAAPLASLLAPRVGTPPPQLPLELEPVLSRHSDPIATEPTRSETPAARPHPEEEALIAAFLSGAGLGEMPPPRLTEPFMRQLGQLLATATQGTVDLIQARAATKHELHAEVTIITPRANNPLKFAPDAQAALHQMIGKRFPGFMEPVEAMQDAYDDLRAHQLGMTAGMRAALHDVLLRFSPTQIESRMTRHTLFDAVLPQNRKFLPWRLYTTIFEQIMDEAENAFDALFGKAFLEAYDREVDSRTQKDAR